MENICPKKENITLKPRTNTNDLRMLQTLFNWIKLNAEIVNANQWIYYCD